VHRAIRNAQELEIRYTSLADTEPRKSTICPETIVLYDGAVYISARRSPTAGRRSSSDDGGMRFFKLDRVTNARVTSRTFDRSPTPVADLLADSITIFRSADPPRRYRVRVQAARARWACEKPFHPGQKVSQEADGSVILDIERAWDDEMVPQLLGLADMVEVLEPEDIRYRLLETAQRIAGMYICHHIREFEALRVGS
jgi:predicted DNA-binding transcriptional regulator YafY